MSSIVPLYTKLFSTMGKTHQWYLGKCRVLALKLGALHGEYREWRRQPLTEPKVATDDSFSPSDKVTNFVGTKHTNFSNRKVSDEMKKISHEVLMITNALCCLNHYPDQYTDAIREFVIEEPSKKMTADATTDSGSGSSSDTGSNAGSDTSDNTTMESIEVGRAFRHILVNMILDILQTNDKESSLYNLYMTIKYNTDDQPDDRTIINKRTMMDTLYKKIYSEVKGKSGSMTEAIEKALNQHEKDEQAKKKNTRRRNYDDDSDDMIGFHFLGRQSSRDSFDDYY